MKAKDLFEAGVSDFIQGRYSEARGAFSKINHRETDPEGVYVDLASDFLCQCYQLDGVRTLSEGRPGEAAPLMEEALSLFPGNRECEFYRAVAHNNAMQFHLAARAFGALIESAPGHAPALTGLAASLLNMGNVGKVEEILGKTISLNADLCHLLAVARFRVKKLQEADDLLRRAATLKQGFVDAMAKRLGTLILLKQFEAAADVLGEVLSVAPDRTPFVTPAHFLSSVSQPFSDSPAMREMKTAFSAGPPPSSEDVRRWADALFHQMIFVDVLDVPFHGSRGELIRQDWFRAMLIRHYQNMVQKGVEAPEVYFRIAREFQRLNRHSDALDYFRLCLEKNPRFLPAKISMAFGYLDLGMQDDALRLFEALYSDFKNIPDLVLYSSDHALEEEPYQGKEDHLRAELGLLLAAAGQEPRYADLYFNIGRLYYMLEEPERALDYFDKAGIVNPEFIRANIGKAVTLMQLDRNEQARDVLNRTTTQSTLFSKVVYNLAAIHRRLGHGDRHRELCSEIAGLGNEYAALASREIPPSSGA